MHKGNTVRPGMWGSHRHEDVLVDLAVVADKLEQFGNEFDVDILVLERRVELSHAG